MTHPRQKRSGRKARITLLTTLLLVGAVAAWVTTALQAREMGIMPGTMGMSLVAFDLMWIVMMAAMMLPSIVPLATSYTRMIQSRRLYGLVTFTAGYLAVWAAAGIVAFGLAWATGKIAYWSHTAALIAAVATFAACGVYQLTSWKNACLTRCRAPVSLLMEYASWRGPLRHFRVGCHHGAFCLGCCSLLMALMFVFGVMNIGAMVALTVVTSGEKVWTTSNVFPRVVGLACLALAVAVIWFPWLAPGLLNSPAMMMDMMNMEMG